MSTWLYLECHSHTPHLVSDDVGQHLSELPQIRGLLANREVVAAAVRLDLLGEIQSINHACRFIAKHPECDIHIADEYGKEHPITEDQP
ncbi:MAG: hypothetical protein ACTH9H_12930 [Galactobacter sp.]